MKRTCEPVGKLKFFHSAYKVSKITRWWNGQGATIAVEQKTHVPGTKNKMKIGIQAIEWLIKVIEYKGHVLPPELVLGKLLTLGYVKLELTEEGKEYYEDTGKQILLMRNLQKLNHK